MRGSGTGSGGNIIAIIGLGVGSSGRGGGSVVEIGIIGIAEDARDDVESIRSDSWASSGGTVGVHHGEKGGSAGRGRVASDEGSETRTRSEAGAGGEAGARGEASAEGGRIKAEMGRGGVGLWLRAGEHSGGEGTGSERVHGVVVVAPGVGSLGGRGDGGERREDRTRGRGGSLRRGARVGSGLGGIRLVWNMIG